MLADVSKSDEIEFSERVGISTAAAAAATPAPLKLIDGSATCELMCSIGL